MAFMTRDHEVVGARRAVRPRAQLNGPPPTYPIRQFVAYRRLIERGERVDPAAVVAEFARANPDIDLDARSTFADWRSGFLPGHTAVRPRVLVD